MVRLLQAKGLVGNNLGPSQVSDEGGMVGIFGCCLQENGFLTIIRSEKLAGSNVHSKTHLCYSALIKALVGNVSFYLVQAGSIKKGQQGKF